MITDHYTSPHQFEPLLPQFRLDELRSRSRSVIEKAEHLSRIVDQAGSDSLRALVRSSNAYYSNWLEGQSTSPENIERALRDDFSDEPGVAKLQRLAVAHIEAEKWLEQQAVAGKPCLSNESHTAHYGSCLSSDFLKESHTALYSRLPIEDRTQPDGRVLVPGALREMQVCVGRHEPPLWSSVPGFLDRMDQVYSKRLAPEDLLIHVAAAHHRAAWVHPFLDGNGRAVRLQTHCALLPISSGLWSISRGIALDRDRYYSLMDAADAPRQGDLDGRGNLSEKALWAWCAWFITVMEGEVDFSNASLDANNRFR